MGENIRNKISHKEVKYFFYYRGILHRNNFDLVHCTVFEHMKITVTQFLKIWMVKYVSCFCGTNYMRQKWKEVPNYVCPCWNWAEKLLNLLHQIHCQLLPRIRLFKDIMDYFQNVMNFQDIEPTLGEIICWYIKWKRWRLYQ